MLQMNPGEHALYHIGAVQAVNAVDPKDAPLPGQDTLTVHIEAESLKISPDLIPQQTQSAE